MAKNTEQRLEALIYECLVDAIKSLKKGVIYKAEDVFPSEVWDALPNLHIQLGRILSKLVKKGRLRGLKRAQKTDENHCQYIYG